MCKRQFPMNFPFSTSIVVYPHLILIIVIIFVSSTTSELLHSSKNQERGTRDEKEKPKLLPNFFPKQKKAFKKAVEVIVSVSAQTMYRHYNMKTSLQNNGFIHCERKKEKTSGDDDFEKDDNSFGCTHVVVGILMCIIKNIKKLCRLFKSDCTCAFTTKTFSGWKNNFQSIVYIQLVFPVRASISIFLLYKSKSLKQQGMDCIADICLQSSKFPKWRNHQVKILLFLFPHHSDDWIQLMSAVADGWRG